MEDGQLDHETITHPVDISETSIHRLTKSLETSDIVAATFLTQI